MALVCHLYLSFAVAEFCRNTLAQLSRGSNLHEFLDQVAIGDVWGR